MDTSIRVVRNLSTSWLTIARCRVDNIGHVIKRVAPTDCLHLSFLSELARAPPLALKSFTPQKQDVLVHP